MWIKFSHVNILSVNNTTSLSADLFQQCSNLAITVQVLKYLMPWFHRSLLLLWKQLNTRASFGISCPANSTQFICWFIAQTASLVVICLLPYSPQSALGFLPPVPTSQNSPPTWILDYMGTRETKTKVLHAHFWNS